MTGLFLSFGTVGKFVYVVCNFVFILAVGLSSPREINKGDEIAWYADGDYTVRNEYNSSTAYGFG